MDNTKTPPTDSRMITPSRIAELRKLADEATPGPWSWVPAEDDDLYDWLSAPTDELMMHSIDSDEGSWIAVEERNALFIAACREAVPALLDEIERLQTENEELSETLRVNAESADEEVYRITN